MTNEDLIAILDADYQQAFNYRERRHAEWNENYTFYRGRVALNRLTQRQNVSIPLMKETIKTWLANIDDPPELEFEEQVKTKTEEALAKKLEKEIVLNEYWLDFKRKQKVDLKDIVDKRQVGLYGRSFKKLNVIDGEPMVEIVDPQNVLIDRYTDPADIDTASFLFHIGIYRTLKSLEENPNYSQAAVRELKEYYTTEEGLIKAEENLEAVKAQVEKLEKMGVPDVESPSLGETYVELNECYRKLWNGDRQEIYLIVKTGDKILMNKPLEEVIGETPDNYWRDHYPFSSWADDIEQTDFWSDALADIIRPINKVLNSWFSQLVENRTLKNFGMNFYDATDPRFIPQTYDPVPWGWYPVPGDPNKIIKRVDVPDLKESLPEMEFLRAIAERATAVTAIQKGVTERKQITLGEVQLLAGRAQERAIHTAKFYLPSWKDFGFRWYKFIEAQAENLKPVKLAKKGWKTGRLYTRLIQPKHWLSKDGYQVKVYTSAEQEASGLDTIQKFTAVLGQMPDNIPLKKHFQRKLLDLVDLNPEEIKEVMEFEEQKVRALMMPTPPVPPEAEIPTEKLIGLRETLGRALAPE